MSTRDRSKAVQ